MAYVTLESREYTLEEVMTWEDSEWLVDGFVEEHSCIFISAQPKMGKSFFALRLAAAVSSGSELFGFETKKGNVLYLAAERAKLMKRRVQALQKAGVPIEYSNFRLWPTAVMFADHDEVRSFAKSLKQVPKLLIVDTLRRCNDGDERDNTHMGEWTKGVELFRDLTGASVVVVHHDHRESYSSHGRKMDSSFSGAGAILGNLDGYFSLKKEGTGTIRIACEGSNELNSFQVRTVIENVELGNSKSSGVMVEVDDDGVIGEKPDLWELAKDTLRKNPNISQERLRLELLEDEVVQSYWPSLSAKTISIMLDEHHTEVVRVKKGTSKFLSLGNNA